MHISPTPESIASFAQRGLADPIRMLNLLQFRETADYSGSPDLAPDEPISGADAYQVYSAHTIPLLTEVGGKAIFTGTGGPLLIGRSEARWDQVLIVEYPDIAAFVAMTQNPQYHAGAGHRTAPLHSPTRASSRCNRRRSHTPSSAARTLPSHSIEEVVIGSTTS